MRFRKKPVVIEAVQWTGQNTGEILKFLGEAGPNGLGEWTPFEIKTLEGVITASVGDWIIKGVAGEFYPCKPAIFDQTYEPDYGVAA